MSSYPSKVPSSNQAVSWSRYTASLTVRELRPILLSVSVPFYAGPAVHQSDRSMCSEAPPSPLPCLHSAVLPNMQLISFYLQDSIYNT